MMSGFGDLASGGSSSTPSSNLSPLAPPFTVDRLNSSIAIPNSLLNDPLYGLPYSQPRQYTPHTSASRAGLLSEDSMKTTSVPLAEERSISQSAGPSNSYWSTIGVDALRDELSYISEGRPYIPYASPVGSNSTPFLSINESSPQVLPTSGVQTGSVSSQLDYTQSLAGLGYSLPSGVGIGVAHMNRCKQLADYLDLYLDSARAGGSNHSKSSINLGAHALERIDENDFEFLKSLHAKEFCQKKYCPSGTFSQPLDPYSIDNILAPKSSTPVVIRPPAAVPDSSTKRATSQTGDIAKHPKFQIDGRICPEFLKGEELHQALSSRGKGVFLGSNRLNMHKDDYDLSIFNASSRPLKESLDFSSELSAAKQRLESSLETHASFLKRLDDMPLVSDGFQALRRNEGSQDGLDQHNPNVDSPCWKGAPASGASPFDAEHMHQPQENHHLPADFFPGSTSNTLCDSNGVQTKNGSALDGKKALLNENGPAKELLPTDAGKVELESQTQDSHDPKNCSVDSILKMKNVSESCNVALDGAEKVLHSSSSQEGSEHAHGHGRSSSPKMDLHTLVINIQNLSELLQSECSNGEPAFRDEDHQALKNTISNLNACIPKKIPTMNATQDKMLTAKNTADETKEDIALTLPQIKTKPGRCDVRKEDVKPFLSTSSSNITKEDTATQAILKVLQENFEFDGETESQALLFKNLWLEAEARLCSLSYKARFDHMKIAMNLQSSTKAADENPASAEKIPNLQSSPENPASEEKFSSLLPSSPMNREAESSVMARLKILKGREGNSEGEQKDSALDNVASDWEHVVKEDFPALQR